MPTSTAVFWLIKDQSIAEDVVQETLRAWRSLDAPMVKNKVLVNHHSSPRNRPSV